MKNLSALLLTAIILLSLTACGNSANNDTATSDNAFETSATMEVDENLLTVDITLPASFFTDMTEEEIKEAAKEKDIKECVVNEDGTVVYTMAKKAHKELLSELKTECDKTITGLLEGENKVASFISIDYEDDFSEFDVYVDPATYSSFDGIYALGFYISGAYYQAFAGVDYEDIDVVVNFIDNETKDVVNTSSYKEYMESTPE